MRFIKGVLQWLFPKKFILGRIKNCPGLVLTFDDGPHPINTPVLLDELAKRNIKAAFFVTGQELEKYPELGKRIVDEGHLLANHTYEHLNVKDVPFSIYKESIEKTQSIISNITGKNGRIYFRPPYSSFSLKLIWYVLTTNCLLFNWNVDSRDSFVSDKGELIYYLSELDLVRGDILLFHEDYPYTISAIPNILDNCLKHCYSFERYNE